MSDEPAPVEVGDNDNAGGVEETTPAEAAQSLDNAPESDDGSDTGVAEAVVGAVALLALFLLAGVGE